MFFGQIRRRDDNIKEVDIVIKENNVKLDDEVFVVEIVRLKEIEFLNADFSKEVERLFQDRYFKGVDF